MHKPVKCRVTPWSVNCLATSNQLTLYRKSRIQEVRSGSYIHLHHFCLFLCLQERLLRAEEWEEDCAWEPSGMNHRWSRFSCQSPTRGEAPGQVGKDALSRGNKLPEFEVWILSTASISRGAIYSDPGPTVARSNVEGEKWAGLHWMQPPDFWSITQWRSHENHFDMIFP